MSETDSEPGAKFTEAVKKQARQFAGYKCCFCHVKPVDDVHHILPREEGGSNDLDNAAPLCAQCHRDQGSRPEQRKRIREVRDYWYERVEVMYGSVNLEKLQTIEETMVTKADFNQLRNLFSQYLASVEQGSTGPQEAMSVASTIMSSISVPSGGLSPTGYPVRAVETRRCPSCGVVTERDPGVVGEIVCPRCGR